MKRVSSRAIIFDAHGNIKTVAQYQFPQIYPKPGWVEHDPMEIIYSQFLSTPKYSSSATIYAVNQDDTKISTSELAISNYLTKDCCELIMSRTVLEEVISELGLDTTYEGIRNKVTVSNSEDTRFINVKVTTDDPEQARLIADGICEVSKGNQIPKPITKKEKKLLWKRK